MSYKNLQIWQIARELTIEIHAMSLKLPKFEQFEEGQQIRRSIKSVRANIVEGYGRRYYKLEYIKFIIYALASNDESIDHLDTLFETKSLPDEKYYNSVREKLDKLGRKINNFLQAIERDHTRPNKKSPKDAADENPNSES